MPTGVVVLIALIAAIQSGPVLTGATQSKADALQCVRFQSAGRLLAGTSFRADLLLGLEFRLSSDWSISVGPKGEPALDYLWVVSPPLRTAPHRIIGPAYGMTARDSLKIERPLRFVLTKPEHSAAIAAIALQSDETLKQLDQLGRGRLSLQITDHHIRDIILPDGRQADAFEWITFSGEACVPAAARATMSAAAASRSKRHVLHERHSEHGNIRRI
jgi:hypothetical protein